MPVLQNVATFRRVHRSSSVHTLEFPLRLAAEVSGVVAAGGGMVEIGIELGFAILARPSSWDAGFGDSIGATYCAEGKSLGPPV